MTLPGSEDRVGVRKRETIKTSEGHYLSAEFWIERTRPQGMTIGDALAGMGLEVDQALERARKQVPQTQTSSSTPAQLSPGAISDSGLDPATIEKANWAPDSTGKGQWILADELPALRDNLTKANKHTGVLGAHSYKFWTGSDSKGRISRWPRKSESSTNPSKAS
jgi:hypothetical protein